MLMRSVTATICAVCVLTGGPQTSLFGDEPQPILAGSDTLTTGIPGQGPLTDQQITKWLVNPDNHKVLTLSLPLGLSAGSLLIEGLQNNPLTRAKIELGRQLYFDTRLSADNTVSCASCHHPDEGYARHTQFGVGIGGQQGGRNSPVSYNRILSAAQFWDGRADSLEAQAIGPIANPIEMGNTHAQAVKTLKQIPGYVQQFQAIFKSEEPVTIENVGAAIATFERVIVSGPSAYDYSEGFRRFADFSADDLVELKDDAPSVYQQYLEIKSGLESHPMSASALRGQELFFSKEVNCAACHVGANLADEKYHNLGIGMDPDNPDAGRFAVTADPQDWGAFKTPTIRNVELSAPYMHDGSLNTLEDVVEHYNKGGTPNRGLSNKIIKLNLTDTQKKDLVAFMKACTGPFPRVERERLPMNATK